ncbi:hypothetical protein RHSIM_Rhsim11G0023400 [Rhododendron simsii]|uniref:Mitochondrial protein n=1 Tax=Rhododendron simsii TaxID=118357 RepID=A0A834LAA9_RHOSS|nr:hypothetical protein RHSIM_Rhsim11G0023400 [Rhododendron simsii]
MESINVVVDDMSYTDIDTSNGDAFEFFNFQEPTVNIESQEDVDSDRNSEEEEDIKVEEKGEPTEEIASLKPSARVKLNHPEAQVIGKVTDPMKTRKQVRDEVDKGLFISQSNYAKGLVSKFGLESAKHARTPMSTTTKLARDSENTDIDQTLYRSMIGSLLYLTASRPDIAFSVGLCARYQACPKESHLSAVKRIIKYISGTLGQGIWFTRDTTANLAGYCDADWAGCADDRKSTSGGCFYIGNNLVSWLSKKQNSISLSTAEAEYIAAGKQPLTVEEMLLNLTLVSTTPIIDNL